jgi:hypothetical protein
MKKHGTGIMIMWDKKNVRLIHGGKPKLEEHDLSIAFVTPTKPTYATTVTENSASFDG